MKYLPVLAAASLATVASFGQTTVFSDNFDRATLAGGTYTYTTTAGGDGGASVASNILVLTNDSSGTANTAGRTYVTVPLASFSAPFASTLSANAGVVTWSFNMRTSRTSMSGFDNTNYGIAFVLAGTSSDFTAGNGYAIAIGNGSTPDPLRLVRYTGGVDANANLTNIITGIAPVADIASAQYLSVSVSYDPTNNTWSMSARNDGAASFVDPATGSLTSIGSVVDSTYTGSAMTSMGFLWAYSTTTNTASFDNVTVTAVSAVPEPSTYAALAGALALVGVMVHRRRAA